MTGTPAIARPISAAPAVSASGSRASLPDRRSLTVSIASHGISSAIEAECLLIRLSITTTNVGSETAAIWLVSLCVSTSMIDRLIPARSCHTSESWWTSDSNRRCVSTVSISLNRRSRGGLSGEPPSRRSRHISTNDCSTVNSILVPSG